MQASSLYLLPERDLEEDLETSDSNKSTRYYDRKSGLSPSSYHKRLNLSTTLYLGNLSFFTTES